jgi:hypothetical protein
MTQTPNAAQPTQIKTTEDALPRPWMDNPKLSERSHSPFNALLTQTSLTTSFQKTLKMISHSLLSPMPLKP